ncbi:MAG: hypothetical protein SP4CHLAM5_10180 [Chlamydiia bacterium]|nr:hypothetical protein [Chlamydiia bacterium]MCH9618875.1 hypothetical protein [Chlamydiia bacterium]MCH9623964.1 hypothetical protein [Chlamydiia bacterium]
MIKKRTTPFLILEVLIAFMLIAMTILPFSSYPYKVFSKELKLLEKMTMEPYFTDAFFDAYHQKDKDEILLEPIQIPFGEKNQLTVKRSATIDQETVENSQKSLITVKITLSAKNEVISREKIFCQKKTT